MKVTDFVKTGKKAQFSHYRAGFLYYKVSRTLEDGQEEFYLFPVEASDLQQATVNNVENSLTLMRYIRKALEDGTFQITNS